MIEAAAVVTTPALAKIDKLTAFTAIAEAKAILFDACALDLADAVDEAQALAVKSGLIDEIGVDPVQALLGEIFGRFRPELEEPERVPALMSEPAIERPLLARSTIDATAYVVRQQDPALLRSWLKKHSPQQRTAIRKLIEARK
jgi:hypothetical protein